MKKLRNLTSWTRTSAWGCFEGTRNRDGKQGSKFSWLDVFSGFNVSKIRGICYFKVIKDVKEVILNILIIIIFKGNLSLSFFLHLFFHLLPINYINFYEWDYIFKSLLYLLVQEVRVYALGELLLRPHNQSKIFVNFLIFYYFVSYFLLLQVLLSPYGVVEPIRLVKFLYVRVEHFLKFNWRFIQIYHQCLSLS